ncbi:SE1832 family protein [Metabacillus malikii]|uniref:Ribosomal protein L29 n=1 Tax=Metabacillus malikii TaxID=1504265 RepID=A0ABT9ZBN8_9BACI|nr:SE1832 family protein [Metabacillus malikii]MDQ0229252.1 ribosomal protein L29 [Metabacillus malikii]
MNKNEINQRIDELKMDYVRTQGDIEKLESTGNSTERLEAKLTEIEESLAKYRSMLTE